MPNTDHQEVVGLSHTMVVQLTASLERVTVLLDKLDERLFGGQGRMGEIERLENMVKELEDRQDKELGALRESVAVLGRKLDQMRVGLVAILVAVGFQNTDGVVKAVMGVLGGLGK